ncbi:hypothetical protein FK530_23095 [Tsukamurella conjunctivitidis]|uniref:Uncharacterized protein n=3 Tax=Tsukamurella TaxID=2060 RepID=A0A5C5RSU4_9ACTN|nr:hypothetical protein FK530_23095 [Tsukamurella conjunctivitidis]
MTGPIPTSGIAPLADHEEAMDVRVTPRRGGAESLLWLVSPHGGAGVSTLAQMLPFAGDGGRKWPGVPGQHESPLCALVVRDSMDGLDAAHVALRQYYTEQIPSALIALIVVAANRGERSPQVRRKRDLVFSLADRPAFGEPLRIFSVPWLEQFVEIPRSDLPVVPDQYVAPRRAPKDLRQGVHPAVGELAMALHQHAVDELPHVLPS